MTIAFLDIERLLMVFLSKPDKIERMFQAEMQPLLTGLQDLKDGVRIENPYLSDSYPVILSKIEILLPLALVAAKGRVMDTEAEQ